MRDLPGFHYDATTRKYYRIQPGHRATPGTATKYTAQAIRGAEREEAKRAATTLRSQRQTQQTVRRARARKALSLAVLDVRLGVGRKTEVRRLVELGWAGRLRCRRMERDSRWVSGWGFVGDTFSIGRRGTLRVGYVVPSAPGHGEGVFSRVVSAASKYRCADGNEGGEQRTDQGEGLRNKDPFVFDDNCIYRDIHDYRHANLIATLQQHGRDYAMVTCEGEGSNWLTIRGLDSHDEPSEDLGWIDDMVPESLNLDTSVSRVWDIASAPEVPTFVIATSAGLIRGVCPEGVAVRDSYQDSQPGAEYSVLSRAAVMNVSFKDSNVVMAGTRSGRVLFGDIRGGSSVYRLLHSSAVLGTVPIPETGGHHVLVHGFSSTSIYDLRFVSQMPVGKKATSSQVSKWSQPYMNFAVPQDRKSDHYVRGKRVAYSADLGVVAALSVNTNSVAVTQLGNNPSGFVTLYSAKTGRVIDSPLTRHKYHSGLKSVGVRRLRDGPESILVLHSEGLDEWTVEDLGNDNEVEKMWREDRFDQYYHDYGRTPNVVHEFGIEEEWDRGNDVVGRIRS